jgi:quercetin dioxygenase-like cupin family protein
MSKIMNKGKVVNSWEVKSYVVDEKYSSKMLLDDMVAGGKSILLVEGTLKGGCSTAPGGVHTATEIYYIVKGEAVLYLGEEKIDIKAGSVVYIPAGVKHYLDNKSKTEDFVLLALWEDAEQNDLYNARIKAWGKSFKTIYED